MESTLDLQRLLDMIASGMNDASTGLTSMAMRPIKLAAPRVGWMPLAEVPRIAGGTDAVVAAAYLGVEGDLTGHLMLLFPHATACRLVDYLLGNPDNTTVDLDVMAISALGEAGNICGSFLLNALANGTGLTIIPTAPTVVVDMADAILESIVAQMLLTSDEALVVETRFSGDISGHFLLLPDPESMDRLTVRLRQ